MDKTSFTMKTNNTTLYPTIPKETQDDFNVGKAAGPVNFTSRNTPWKV